MSISWGSAQAAGATTPHLLGLDPPFPQLGIIYQTSGGETPSSKSIASAGFSTLMGSPQRNLLASRSPREGHQTITVPSFPLPWCSSCCRSCVKGGGCGNRLGKVRLAEQLLPRVGGGYNCLSSQDPRDTSGPTQQPSEKENGVPTQRKCSGLVSSTPKSGSRTVAEAIYSLLVAQD